ncbi:biliverdin-producing heme oxygenase [Pedobacter sp. Leaf194]|uniref:biliverdin-producing heme oxygenase n=1 Tax=Pedobacter sp. Leaf194 TaxID=1736297 RepID=UPI0007037388|nr:biliverdin-producing heme oxygenase [Pedobacter sp. Leaf194]KQS32406.1 hypothetical protein ASG14_16075 [Pedobacter sp. Leaf194]
MISNLLRSETADRHKALEAMMFVNEIMNRSLSVEEYKTLLIVNYIVHQKLENTLANSLDANIANKMEMNSRLKLTSLERDLTYWNIDPLTLPALDFELFIPEKNNAAVLGAFYVLEGATLGGNVIKKHLLSNRNFEGHEAGLNYYGVYGEQLGAKWKTFLNVLNETVKEEDYALCVTSANRTFDNLIRLAEQLQ